MDLEIHDCDFDASVKSLSPLLSSNCPISITVLCFYISVAMLIYHAYCIMPLFVNWSRVVWTAGVYYQGAICSIVISTRTTN